MISAKENPRQAPFSQWGGSQKYAKRLAARLPEHKVYVEPFAGAGAVLFAKTPAPIEVLADIDPDVAFAHRYIRAFDNHKAAQLNRLDWRVSRAGYNQAKALKPRSSAARFWKLVYGRRATYGSLPFRRNYGYASMDEGGSAWNEADARRFSARLKGVRILHQDWRTTLRQFDSPHTLFFIDPPYVGEWDISEGISPEEIAKEVSHLKGEWIVAYTNSARARRAFKGIGHQFTLQIPEMRHRAGFSVQPRLFISSTNGAKHNMARGDVHIDDILRRTDLTPAQRARFEALRDQHESREPAKEKHWRVSFFDKRHRKLLTIPFAIRADTKSGAIAEARARQSGNPKDLINFTAEPVKRNSQSVRSPRVSKGAKKNGTCARCGGAHHAAYCNAKGNLFGFGKAAKKRRRRKAKIAAAKATVASAKAQLLAAKANRGSSPRVSKGVKNRGGKKWIQKAVKRPGALHRALGVPEGEKIPIGALIKAAETGAKKLAARARFALVRQGYRKVDGRWAKQNPSRKAAKTQSVRSPRRNRAGLITLSLAYAAGRDAGNRHMRRAGRRAWNKSDFNHAANTLNQLWDFKRHAPRERGRNPMHPLEITSHIANLLMGATAAESLGLFGKKKKRKGRSAKGKEKRNSRKVAKPQSLRGPRVSKGVVQNTSANDKLFKRFRGAAPSGAVMNGVALDYVPAKTIMLGPLHSVELRNGGEQKFPVKINYSATERDHNGHRLIKNVEGSAWLAASHQNGGRDRYHIVQKNPMSVPNGLRDGELHNYGEAKRVWYWAQKKHLYKTNGNRPDPQWYLHYHDCADEGGQRPTVVMRNGVLGFTDGSYKIQRAGIRD